MLTSVERSPNGESQGEFQLLLYFQLNFLQSLHAFLYICWHEWIYPKLSVSYYHRSIFCRSLWHLWLVLWVWCSSTWAYQFKAFTLCCLKCRNWTSLKYWLLPTDGDTVWRHFKWLEGLSVSNIVMFMDLRSNTVNVPRPTAEQFQWYRCSVVRDAWCHKST